MNLNLQKMINGVSSAALMLGAVFQANAATINVSAGGNINQAIESDTG